MLKNALSEIFERDLLKLKEEVNLYEDETTLWIIKNEISNSAGNLCLHLIGNLNHFIGAALGKTGYVRDREGEFSLKNVSRNDINAGIDKTIQTINNTLNNMSQEDFEKDFPLEKHGKIVKTDFMLLHLMAHFSYHLGQINYHRRLIS